MLSSENHRNAFHNSDLYIIYSLSLSLKKYHLFWQAPKENVHRKRNELKLQIKSNWRHYVTFLFSSLSFSLVEKSM